MSLEKRWKKSHSLKWKYSNILSIIIYLNVIHTVSVVLSKRSESRNHVITAGGRDPALWHNKSYLRPAERGWCWCAPNKRIFNGATVENDKKKDQNFMLLIFLRVSSLLLFCSSLSLSRLTVVEEKREVEKNVLLTHNSCLIGRMLLQVSLYGDLLLYM